MVEHAILLTKLAKYDPAEATGEVFRLYLGNKKQFCTVNEYKIIG